jgi:hypothetical protein
MELKQDVIWRWEDGAKLPVPVYDVEDLMGKNIPNWLVDEPPL